MRILLSLIVAPSLALTQAPTYARERARIDSLVAAEVATVPIAGVSIAVVKGRDTIAMRGFGLADVENDVAVTPASVFRIGSVTKQFTSAAIMQLVEKGRLSLDDTLGALLANMPTPWRRITLRQLLNHTSGIPSYTDIGPKWQRRWREDMLPDSLLAFTVADTVNFAPGTKWRYNNTGYVLLGMILDKLAGQPYPRYLQAQFFQPLGLTSTMYCYTQPIIKHRALGYQRQGKQLVNAEYLSMTQPYSAGALCSTAGDLVKWNDALQKGRIVTAASVRTMTTPLGSAASSCYGFGLVRDSLTTHLRISHGGGIHGFQSMLAYYPADSLTVVVLVNSTPAPVDLIAGNLARVVFGLPLEGIAPPRVTLTSADRDKYAGDYNLTLPSANTVVAHVKNGGERVLMQIEGQGEIELIPYGSNVFGADFDRTVRVTFAVENGRATKFTFRQGGVEMEAHRR